MAEFVAYKYMETKTCQNCKKDFTIEVEDFNFYEKIKVPPPSWCPECRLVRRMLWRNFRSLFKRICGICGKNLVSMYREEKTKVVYCTECWNSDKRNPFLQGCDYDFSRPFFEQMRELIIESPFLYTYQAGNMIRSDYTNYSIDNKDCYLSFSITECENVLYSELIDKSKNVLDCYAVQKLENSSYNISSDMNYNCHFVIESSKCIDSYFLFDCVNCQNCCLSHGLRNQQYFFKNKKLSKENYEKEILNLRLDTYSGFKKAEEIFDKIVERKAIHRYAQIYNSQNSIGDYIKNSKDVRCSFDVQRSENIFNCSRILEGCKDCYDDTGIASGELIYESTAASLNTYKQSFCYISLGSRECEYSIICRNCNNCFACVGLTNAEYCIFNKQYKKEEYFEIVEKIKKHMNEMPYIDENGRIYKYGEFYPPNMSPFAYNLSTANDFLPSSKEEVLQMGYPWDDRALRNYNITIKSKDLPDSIKDVSDKILDEVIACPNDGDQHFQCSSAYKIMSYELQFYKDRKLPLPRYCPNCRHYQGLRFRNPIRLYERSCMHKGCVNKFQTTYTTDRPEILYCEKCYQQEVY